MINEMKKLVRKETHKRSMARSILWRVMGIFVLALVTFAFTRNWIQTTAITFIHHGMFLIIYYLHERLWQRIGDRVTGKKRKILRAFLYEIILGHCVLGTISLVITGSWSTVTWITITYIENKLWIYVVYDWIWGKVSWESQ